MSRRPVELALGAALCVSVAACACGDDECPAGMTDCYGSCIDLMSNDTSCGSCGDSCGTLKTCLRGRCECRDDAPRCGGDCVYLMSDENNCGACGVHCDATAPTCDHGTCRCLTGTCDFVNCIDFLYDEQHCGDCNTRCGEHEICWEGACRDAGPCDPPCDAAAGELCCEGTSGFACAAIWLDEANCGECGNFCEDGPCQLGRCSEWR